MARQPPTLTTLPHRAPLAPPTLLPTHMRTHTHIRINTMLLCKPPTRTRLLKHTGPTGTHSLPLYYSTVPSISSIHRHPLNVPSVLSSLSLSLFFLFLFAHKVRETCWLVQVCLFFFSAPFLFSLGFITISGLFHLNSWSPSDEIVSVIALLLSFNLETLEIKNRAQT